MKIIDKDGRIGGKISVIDIIVILICVLVVIAVGVKFGGGNVNDSQTDLQDITYTVKVPGIRQGSVDSFKVGDQLYIFQNGDAIGEITGLKSEPAKAQIMTDDGEWVEGPVEDRFDLYLTVKGKAAENGGHVYANRVDELNVNSDIKMATKYVEFTGTITELNK